jgi:hypothetical protein
MSTPDPVSRSVGFMTIHSAATPPAGDDPILSSYFGIVAYHLLNRGPQPPGYLEALTTVEALPALLQVASVQRSMTSQPRSLDLAATCLALSQGIGQALQLPVARNDVFGGLQGIAEPVYQSLSSSTASATIALVVLDGHATDTPTIGVLQLTMVLESASSAERLPPSRPSLRTDGSWVAFSVNDAQRDAARKFVESIRSTQRIIDPQAIPNLLRVTLDRVPPQRPPQGENQP